MNPATAANKFLFVSYFLFEKFEMAPKIIAACLIIPFLFVFWIFTLAKVLKINEYIASLFSVSSPVTKPIMISNPASNPENKV